MGAYLAASERLGHARGPWASGGLRCVPGEGARVSAYRLGMAWRLREGHPAHAARQQPWP